MAKKVAAPVATPIHVSVAAVNLDATVFDTNDLSTVRGSSLALLDATELALARLCAEMKERYQVNVIRQGASELTVQLNPNLPAADGSDAVALIRAALAGPQQLADDAPKVDLGQFTFTIATERANQPSKPVIAALQARGRTRQYEQLTVPLPEAEPAATIPGTRPCRLDRVRAGTVNDGGDRISRSVAGRRRYGRNQRSRFYRKRLREAGETGVAVLERLDVGLDGARIDFAQSFDDLRAKPAEARELGLKVALQGKIGIIHLDGNGFGALVARHYDNPAKFAAISAEIRRLQAGLLADILSWLLDRSDHLATPPAADSDAGGKVRRLRFETLLWGGDEMTFAAPAWAAFDLLDRIVAAIEPWRLPRELGDTPLRHKIGLVIAHHKMPVYRLKTIADELARAAKTEDERTNVQILALAGVDLPDGSLDELRKDLFGLPASVGNSDRHFDLVPANGSWAATTQQLRRAIELLPRAFVNTLVERFGANLSAAHIAPETEQKIADELNRNTSVADNATEIGSLLFPRLARRNMIGPLGYGSFTRLLPLLQIRDLAEIVSPLGPGCRPNSSLR